MDVPSTISPRALDKLSSYCSAPGYHGTDGGLASAVSAALGQLGALSVPVIAALLIVRRVRKHNASKPKPPAEKQQAQPKPAAPKPVVRPRRDVKVKRDRSDITAEAAEARAMELAEQRQRLAAQMAGAGGAAAKEEGEEDGAPAAGAEGDGNFLKMLQSMGFKVVAPNDGSNKLFLVPPNEGAEAGEGDEDEDAEEGEEEEEDE